MDVEHGKILNMKEKNSKLIGIYTRNVFLSKRFSKPNKFFSSWSTYSAVVSLAFISTLFI